jgi:hypothetical protein
VSAAAIQSNAAQSRYSAGAGVVHFKDSICSSSMSATLLGIALMAPFVLKDWDGSRPTRISALKGRAERAIGQA